MKQMGDVNEMQTQPLYSAVVPISSNSSKANETPDLVNDSEISSSYADQSALGKFSDEVERNFGEAKYNEVPTSYPSIQSSQNLSNIQAYHAVKAERYSIDNNEDNRDALSAHNFVQTPQTSHLKPSISESTETEHQQEQTYTPNSNNREQDDDDPDDLLS